MKPPEQAPYILGVAGCEPLDPLGSHPADRLPQIFVYAVPDGPETATAAAEGMREFFEHPRVRTNMIVSISDPDAFPVGASIAGRDSLAIRYRGHRERHPVPPGLISAILERRRFMITLIGRPWPFPAADRHHPALLAAFLNDPATRPRAGIIVPLITTTRHSDRRKRARSPR